MLPTTVTTTTMHRPVRAHHLTQELSMRTPKIHPPSDDSRLWPRDLAIFLGAMVVGLVLVILVISLVIRDMTEEQRSKVAFPTSLEKAQMLGSTLSEYTDDHYYAVLLAHGFVYIYLQTFAIPGTVFANLLAGALFGMWVGFPLCLFYNTLGSCCLYWFSQLLGRRLVRHFLADRMVAFRTTVNANRTQLTLFMIFARVFPFTPNWFINVASPQLHIPVWQFAVGVGVGLIPYNFLSCKAGLLLASLKSKSDIIDTATTIQLAGIAVIGFLVPLVYKRLQGKRRSRTLPPTPTIPEGRVLRSKPGVRPRANSCSL